MVSKGAMFEQRDLCFIQKLEGNKSLKTTEIYTHVRNKDIGKIRSPLDSLFEKE